MKCSAVKLKNSQKIQFCVYLSIYLIFSPLKGQTEQRAMLNKINNKAVEVPKFNVNENAIVAGLDRGETTQSQPIMYTVILTGGISMHSSSFKYIQDDSLVLLENNLVYIVPLEDILRITKTGKNKFKKGAVYGATIGFGSSFLYKLSLFSSAQFDLLKYGWVAGASVGTLVGGITGAFLAGDKNQYMIGWSIDQKRATIQKMIEDER